MAATVSSVWAKPGAWALDAEEHEEELKRQIESTAAAVVDPPAADFPSLAAAAAAPKSKKKSRGQTLSLSEFAQYSNMKASTPARYEKLTTDELLQLPTAPRQRSAEELEQGRLGGGFRNYGGDRGSSRVSSDRERVDLGPSRADEADDWSKMKKFSSGSGGGSSFGGGERREKVGFFGGASRADEADSWGSNKSYNPAPSSMDGGRRDRRMGFDSFANGGGADSDTWTRKGDNFADARRFDRGYERERKVVGFESSGAADSDNWLKKKDEKELGSGGGGLNGGRPRLNLQPRSLPVSDGNGSSGSEAKPKGSNPFGEARPREEVLKEKGKDWKEIDEKLEAAKKEAASRDGPGFGRKAFGLGRADSSKDDSIERSWRKTEAGNDQPVRADESQNGDSEKTDDDGAGKSETGDTENTE